MTSTNLGQASCWVVASTRFLGAFAVAIWVGGMTFFGAVAAPILFDGSLLPKASPLPPQLVGALLSRFGTVTLVCSMLLVVSLAVEWLASRAPGRKRWFEVRAGLTLICVVMAFYLALTLMPRLQSAQPAMLPVYERTQNHLPLTVAQQHIKATFDQGHENYKTLAIINLWLVVGLLGLMIAQSTFLPEPGNRGID